MERLSLSDFTEALRNEENQYGVMVFKDVWNKGYELEELSYVTNSSWGKWFKSGMCGNSLVADVLKGQDRGVRIDWYLYDEELPWKIDYCYLITEEEYNELVKKRDGQ